MRGGIRMREVKRKSAIPVYIAAGVYALYALLFPLYSIWHFFIAAVVTAAAWLIADSLIKPVTEYISEPEPEPEPAKSYGEAVDAVLAEAKRAHDEMLRLSASIGDPDITARIEALTALSDRIASDAIDDHSDVNSIQKFQRYFLPSTIGLLNAYDRMSGKEMEGENLTVAKARIREMLDTEIASFRKQLDALYANDAMSIDADIRVMQMLLEREGLLEEDELHRLIRRAETDPS